MFADGNVALPGAAVRDHRHDQQLRPCPSSSPEQSAPSLTDPVRYPPERPAPVRTKRAFVLILLTLLVPGSAQIVAGDRRLGRTALRVTLTVWALAVLAVLLLLVSTAPR